SLTPLRAGAACGRAGAPLSARGCARLRRAPVKHRWSCAAAHVGGADVLALEQPALMLVAVVARGPRRREGQEVRAQRAHTPSRKAKRSGAVRGTNSDDPAADRIHGRLDAVVDLELHEDVRDVVLDGLRADV